MPRAAGKNAEQHADGVCGLRWYSSNGKVCFLYGFPKHSEFEIVCVCSHVNDIDTKVVETKMWLKENMDFETVRNGL